MKSGKIFLLALLVRLLFILLAMLSDSLSPDYDNSMAAEALPFLPSSSSSTAPAAAGGGVKFFRLKVFSLLDPLMRWDAVHFRHIAKFGYTHEHLCAFFPSVPRIFQIFGLVEKASPPSSSSSSSVQAAFQTPRPNKINEILFLSFHILIFALSSVLLREILVDLILRIFFSSTTSSSSSSSKNQVKAEKVEAKKEAEKKEQPQQKEQEQEEEERESSPLEYPAMILKSCLLVWFINPASIFFTAAYTENYFAFLSFAGIFCIQKLFVVSGAAPDAVAASLQTAEESADSSSPLNKKAAMEKNSLTKSVARREMQRKLAQLGEEVILLRFEPEKREENENEDNNNNDDDDAVVASETVELTSASAATSSQKEGVDGENKNTKNQKRRNSTSPSSSSSSSSVSFSKSVLYAFGACFFFWTAGSFRSNSILLTGFFLHFVFLGLWKNEFSARKAKQEEEEEEEEEQKQHQLSVSQKLLLCLICLVCVFVCLLPYKQHVEMCFQTFCPSSSSSSSMKRRSDFETVCGKGVSGFYSAIQLKYWKVGLFQYYTANNIPNFIIALPTFLFCSLGLIKLILFVRQQRKEEGKENNNENEKSVVSFLRRILLLLAEPQAAHFVYLSFQLLFALVAMNVQVVTRFVSATPALYLLYGTLIALGTSNTANQKPSLMSLLHDPAAGTNNKTKNSTNANTSNNSNANSNKKQQQQSGGEERNKKKRQKGEPEEANRILKMCCLGFCVVWAVVGTALFPNFMPWT